jgi:hypothetical protein
MTDQTTKTENTQKVREGGQSPIHKARAKKNWALLAAIAAFCALIWFVTMVKIGNGL